MTIKLNFYLLLGFHTNSAMVFSAPLSLTIWPLNMLGKNFISQDQSQEMTYKGTMSHLLCSQEPK